MKLKATIISLAAAGALASAVLPASAEDFFSGKRLTIIVGFSPGGVYDLTARVLARHIGNHIPGKPSVIVQTMTGAGGISAVIHLCNNAVRDGTVIGMPPRSYPVAPLSNDKLRYEGRCLTPIGSTTTEVQVGAVWHQVGVTKLDDLMTREISAGVTSYYDDIGKSALIAKSVIGAKLKFVSGYPSGNDITAAMEKGEVDSEFGLSWGAIKSRLTHWLDQKKINIILQFNSERSPELPNVPGIMDYAKSDLDRRALEILMAPNAFAWPFVAPPGVPADRIALLRRAFDATMKDPSFLHDAKQARLELNPMNGEAFQAKVEQILSFDPSVIARAKEMIKPPL